MKVVKLESVRCADLAQHVSQPADVTCVNGQTTFTRHIITVEVPDSGSYAIPISYQIRVSNTGNTTLDLPTATQLDDPMCDVGSVSGPALVQGTLGFSSRTGQQTLLSVGGKALYTCTHNLTQNDPSAGGSGDPFTNTVTVTAYPPSGPPVHGTDIVTVHRHQPIAKHFCTNRRTGKRVLWPDFPRNKPKACRKPPPHPHPKRPKHPRGFTG